MAARFWVGGTGTWDASDTTHWASSSGGAGGASVPGSSDTVTFNAASGGGTVTVNTTVNVQSITCGAFTGTLDFSVNNNDVTLSASAAFNGSGTGTRTINLGNGTWTFTSTAIGIRWTMSVTTGLTFNANSSVLVFSGVGTGPSASMQFIGGGLTYNAIQIGAQANGAYFQFQGANTIASLTVTGPNVVEMTSSTQTIGTLSLNGSASGLILVRSSTEGTARTISVASNAPTMNYCAFRDIACTGGASFVANNSFDLGNNSGITINGSAGGGLLANPGLSGGMAA